jgi:hypothetical protein
MQQSNAPATRSADQAMQNAERALANAQRAMADADRAAQAAGKEGVGNRYISIPDGNGGRTRISLGPTAVTIDNQGTELAPAIATDRPREAIPDGVVDIVVAVATMIVLVAVGSPIARAYARRIDTRTTAAPAILPVEVAQRLAAIEQAVDSVAVEVERISEGQRFTTKLLSERTKVEVERGV